MGANNYLQYRNNENAADVIIYFKYGNLREHLYKVGDEIIWDHISRPDIFPDIVCVPGYSMDGSEMFTYYKIIVNNNVIRSVTTIKEAEFEALEDRIFELMHGNTQ